jgi:ELWxxDGT repeat protein
MARAFALIGFLALASPSSAVGAERLPALPQPTLVADILPGPAGSTPRSFQPVPGGAVFFTGTPNPSSPVQGVLWRTDGTPAGTFSIQPAGIDFVNLLSTPGPYQWLQGHDANGVMSVWRTDGTAAGTVKVLDRQVADSYYWYQRKTGRFYFRAYPFGTSTSFRNLWVSDGTPGGTRQLTSLANPPLGASLQRAVSDPSGGGLPGIFAELGDGVFFVDFAGPQGPFSLWRTDGTPEGTHIVASPTLNFDFQAVWRAGSSLYILASITGEGPARLWKSDGTAAGTVEIDSFGPGLTSGFSLLGELANGRTLWVVLKPPERGASLWATDGRPNGVVRLLNLASSDVTKPLRLNGLLYFVATDGKSGRELWRTDGTPAGTRLAFDRCPGACSGIYGGVDSLLVADRILTFSDDPNVGIEPLVTDGTLAGTHLLGDLCPGPCGGFILEHDLRDFGGAFFFLASHIPRTFPQIWATDLTPAGTVRVTDFPGGVYQTFKLGDRLLFTADDGVTGPELWSLTVPTLDPVPPPGPWLSSRTLPGFEVKVRIANPNSGSGAIAGVLEPDCVPETLCFSGAVRGRSEVFVRVVGPKPNGRLWPTLVKFTTSEVEVWIRQTSTDTVRYYRLEGARPGFDELPGLFDREGFTP